MVDTVSIEVLCHLAETAYPPLAAVFQHLVPVVRGEAPVLTVGRERIGWGTGLTIQIEVLGFYPCLDTVAADADRNVALQDDTMLAGILMGGMHLAVKVVLHIAPEVGHFLVRLGQRLRPCRELCRTVEVAIVAEFRVRLQPLFVILTELLVGSSTFHCCPFLSKQYLQILQFGTEHTFIVNLRQCVQLLTQLFEVCSLFFIFDFW